MQSSVRTREPTELLVPSDCRALLRFGGRLSRRSKLINVQSEVSTVGEKEALLDEAILERFNGYLARNLVDDEARLSER